jgi:uncharacterized membrane protein YcaP (DUF421 family)
VSPDWGEIFGLTVSPIELIVRGTAMYLFLFLVFRVIVRRRIGAIGMADILVLVIIADAAQNGMAGEYRSVTEGAILVGTIIAWKYVTEEELKSKLREKGVDGVRQVAKAYMEPDGSVSVIKR